VDKTNPVPADTPNRKALERFAVPGPNRLMFARIEDFKPVASQDENPQEYDAWIEVAIHANKFETKELEQAAASNLVPLDLVKEVRKSFRLELIRFDGKMSCVRWLEAPPILREAGITELYEIRLVPLDESPLTPVSVVFTQLPESLAEVRTKKSGEWLDRDGWVSAAGYYFKTMTVPGEQANALVGVPILLGKSVTLLAGPPVPPGNNPVAIDKTTRVFRFIKDKARIAPRPSPTDRQSPWEEAAAYDRVLLHASRFTTDELETHARKDLKFADLFLDESHSSYKLDLVAVEGRLISLRRFEPSAEVKAAGIHYLYEGWLIPKDEQSGNPVVIVFLEPLEGVEASGRVNVWVSFAGYSFKKMLYESAEKDPKNPNKNLNKYAPLLIGRQPIIRPDPSGPTSLTWSGFMLAAIIGGIVLIGCGGALAWWYRSGDRQARQEMDAVRSHNPFDTNTNPPA